MEHEKFVSVVDVATAVLTKILVQMQISPEYAQQFVKNKLNFTHGFITTKEPWFHHYNARILNASDIKHFCCLF